MGSETMRPPLQMVRYRINRRSTTLITAIVFASISAVGVLGLVRWSLGKASINGKSQPTGYEDWPTLLVWFISFAPWALLSWLVVCRRTYQLRLHPDDRVEFVRLWGTKTILAGDRRLVVEKCIYKDKNGPFRTVRIRHENDTIHMKYSDEVVRFLSDVEDRLPAVEIRGCW